jgi:hypothetical protein
VRDRPSRQARETFRWLLARVGRLEGEARCAQMVNFAKNLAIIGALPSVFVSGGGRYGLRLMRL